ncbi:hypothetical protein [Acinetobacter gerneri]|uniref:hypothetical protein n=1 Tax=Acinetobacter gerneri TaxID=202952 RepID=UPI0028A8FA34|nr:hypothetical protein [Acinetobacter gerneri]
MIHRINILLLSFYLIFTPTLLFASTSPSGSGGGWKTTNVSRLTLDQIADSTASKTFTDIVEATGRKQAADNAKALNAVVRETVKREAAGKAMMSRLMSGGVAILGVVAVTALVEGVGWVMEEGQYVKYKITEPDPNDPKYVYCFSSSYDSNQCFSDYKVTLMTYCTAVHGGGRVADLNNITRQTVNLYTAPCLLNNQQSGSALAVKVPNPEPEPEPDKKKIVLTDDLLTDLMFGDYTDPVDSSKDKKDDIWTGVEDTYYSDPSGIGNDVADQIHRKFDNSPQSDDKPSNPPTPDGDGYKYPDTGSNTKPDGNPSPDGGTDTNTIPNPDNNSNPDPDNPTQPSGGGSSSPWPAFCDWASVMCEWYEKWKDHREETKSFWEKVKDWFDWTKEPPNLNKDDTEVDIDETEPQAIDSPEVKWNAYCPFEKKLY